jgi:DNA repair protein RadA/Sms
MKTAVTSTHFVCQSCGASARKWTGKCEACGEWNTLIEEQVSATPKGLKPGRGKGLQLARLDDEATPPARTSTRIGELDRVLGGGLVEGSAVLLGGDPGIGKSTLLLQAAASISQSGARILYISGEESLAQIQLRATRLGLAKAPLELAAATSVRDILSTIDKPNQYEAVIIDSIQTMFVDSIESAPGSVAQVRASAHELIKAAKSRGFALILVGHVTKDGQIAGPRVLEHMVDTVLYFEGDRGQLYRILRAVKNRFGATDEIGVFSMGGLGLEEVSNPSSLFLHTRETPVSGASVFAGIEGSRPILVEIQALISPSMMSTPRRATVGFDSNRLAMILAVLETRAGMRFSDKEVFLNVAGGMRILEPAADAAAALALVSALLDKPVPSGLITFGEIGLTGEIRPVARAELRLKEAVQLGFERALIPAGLKETSRTTTLISHVDALVKFMLGS